MLIQQLFSPSGLLGGALIGLAATLLLVTQGRIAGVSGIFAGLWSRRDPERMWRWWFVAGLVAGGIVAAALLPDAFGRVADHSWPWMAAAGLLVGVGTRMAGGCTSGHGICGNSRFSRRSAVATATFIASGVVAVAATRGLLGGA